MVCSLTLSTNEGRPASEGEENYERSAAVRLSNKREASGDRGRPDGPRSGDCGGAVQLRRCFGDARVERTLAAQTVVHSGVLAFGYEAVNGLDLVG